MSRLFDIMTLRVSAWMARPAAFLLAVMSIVAWAALGPAFNYSDQWQMVVNTGTTVVTLLLGFLILAASGRSESAIQAKLDELIRSNDAASNKLIQAELLAAEDLAALRDAPA